LRLLYYSVIGEKCPEVGFSGLKSGLGSEEATAGVSRFR
jgi:hypothetical protein